MTSAEVSITEESSSPFGEKVSLYRAIFENANDVIILWEFLDKEKGFRIVKANPIACERYGYTPQEFIGLRGEDLNTTESLEASKAIQDQLFKFGHAQLELTHKTKSGQQIPSEVFVRLFTSGDKCFAVSVVRDITERKTQETMIRQFANFPFLNPNPVFRISVTGQFLFANPASALLLDCLGINQTQPVPSSLQDVIEKTCQLNTHVEIESACGDKVYSLTFYPNLDEGYVNVYGLDITERNQKKLELENYQKRLEDLVLIRTQALNEEVAVRVAAEKSLKSLYEREKNLTSALKQQIDERVLFTRALVHELKTPLTPLLTASEFLEEYVTDETARSFAKNIRAGALNLDKRVNELLDLARGEVGTLRLIYKTFDLNALLTEIVEYMLPEAKRRGQHLTLEIPAKPIKMEADPDRLRQVVTNLLTNSLKFTRRGGNIKLSAILEKDGALVSVNDTGSGIEAADLPYIFEPYHRSQISEKRRLSGLGLGLVLSRMIVELHGGQIWLKSAKGKGSTFYFKIPYTK